MKKILLLIITLPFAVTVFSQANKSIFLEFAGNGIFLSANFDARFKKTENGLGYRVGLGFAPAFNSGEDILYPNTPAMFTVPIGINYLVGRAPSYLEAGLGLTYVHASGTFSSDFWGYSESANENAIGFFPSIGYRYAKTGKAFQGRIFISPAIGKGGAMFWAGLSVGFKF